MSAPIPRYLDLSVLTDGREKYVSGVEVVCDLAGLDALETDWRQLEQTHAKTFNLFQSFDWCRAFARHYCGPDQDHRLAIVVVRDEGKARLIWPAMICHTGPVCNVRWLGDPYGQYGDVLLEPSRHSPVRLAQAWQALTGIDGVDLIRFRHVRKDAAVTPFLSENAAEVELGDTAPFLDLTAFRDERAYDRRYTKVQRRRRKRIRAELEKRGKVEFRIVPSGVEQDELISQIVNAKRHWLEQRGLYSRAIMCDRIVPMLQSLSHEGRMTSTVTSVLTVGGEPVSWEIGLRFKNRHCGYITAHDARMTDASPARLHMDLSQRRAIADGMQTFDLMVPGDPHKASWSNGAVDVCGFYLPVSAKGRIFGRLYLERLRPMARDVYRGAPANVRRFLTAPFGRHG